MFQPEVDADIVRWLAWTAQGFLPPLAAAVGGVASQEVLKAVTGKFSPLCQWVSSEFHISSHLRLHSPLKGQMCCVL